MRVDPGEYQRLELRAHSLLAGVPLHDVWAVDLPGRRRGRSIAEVRALLAAESPRAASPAVRALFALRMRLGRLFGWDDAPSRASEESFLHRLGAADVASSLVPPGTREGPFQVLFVSAREAISEIRNATVHAFSVLALVERASDHRLYWAIYVRPVGRITAWYMRLIDPFRRLVIYPAVLRRLRAAWSRSQPSFLPAGWPALVPRIAVDDPEGLVGFIQQVFGAAGSFQRERPSELRIGDSILMVGPRLQRAAMPAFLYVYVEDADATWRRALDRGAESVEEPRDMPYGDRRAMIRDAWGNTWQIATHGGRFTP